MKTEFKLLMAALLVGFSALAVSDSTEAGALGDTVGDAGREATGAVGGAFGGVLGGSSSGGSATAGAGIGASVGNKTTKASVILRKKNFAKNQVTVALGNPATDSPALQGPRNRAAAARMFSNMSPSEQPRLVKKCSAVLASPSAFDTDLVALCRMIASLDSRPPTPAQPAKKKMSKTEHRPTTHVASLESSAPIMPVSEPKLDKTEVIHCLGDFPLPRSRLLELQGQLPGCVVWLKN